MKILDPCGNGLSGTACELVWVSESAGTRFCCADVVVVDFIRLLIAATTYAMRLVASANGRRPELACAKQPRSIIIGGTMSRK